MSIILFLVVLFVLVLVHEWGHFIMAKLTGMRVDEFAIGFPPRIFSWQRGETRYSLNIIPLGGYVRIYGENAEDAAQDGAKGEDTSRSFTSRPHWAQAIVLVAGVAMNVLFGWFVLAVALGIGVPTAVDESNAGPTAALTIETVLPGSPAADAGLQPSAVITKVGLNGAPAGALTPSSFRTLTESSAGEPIEITYRFKGEEKTTTLTPKTGVISSDASRAAVGISLALVETKSLSPWQAVKTATVETGHTLALIVVGLKDLLVGAFAGGANLSEVTGPVGIVHMVGEAANFGITSVLLFTAMISFNLAVINLFPFPALDGGRLVFVALEAISRRTINPVWVARINTAGFVALMLLMVAVTWHDIVKL